MVSFSSWYKREVWFVPLCVAVSVHKRRLEDRDHGHMHGEMTSGPFR